ncbi:hypothetical protein AB0O31_10195 [Kitasatospora cineracea]|uniref:hypothetical protein n=1 Tax=Kitasatospora cineracea TaxID=88074 RepID=UPI00343A32D2
MAALLPGFRLWRLLFWRYLLVYRAPADGPLSSASSPVQVLARDGAREPDSLMPRRLLRARRATDVNRPGGPGAPGNPGHGPGNR